MRLHLPMRKAVSEADVEELAALVRAAQTGDSIALTDVLEAVAPYVGRLCAPIALDDAADATQEAMIAIVRGLRRLRDPDALLEWVRVVTVREAVRVARRRPVNDTADLDAVAARGDPQLAGDVRDVLSRLTAEHRAVLMLRDLEGLDEAAVAAMLGVPTGTVKSRLHRARSSFRREWTR